MVRDDVFAFQGRCAGGNVVPMANQLANGAPFATRWTKTVVNMALGRIHATLTETALGYETVTNSSADH